MNAISAQMKEFDLTTTKPIPIWVGHYLGIPYKPRGMDRGGVDDWGLTRLITAEQFGYSLVGLIH